MVPSGIGIGHVIRLVIRHLSVERRRTTGTPFVIAAKIDGVLEKQRQALDGGDRKTGTGSFEGMKCCDGEKESVSLLGIPRERLQRLDGFLLNKTRKVRGTET